MNESGSSTRINDDVQSCQHPVMHLPPNSLIADTVCGNYTDISSANTPTAC